MKKVICFFIHNISNAGGTERVTTLIANQLSRRQYTVVIVSLFSTGNQPSFDLDPDITIRTLFEHPVRGLYSFPLVLWRLRKCLAQQNADVIINVDSILASYSVPVCRASRRAIRNVCWEHFNYNITLGKTMRSVARTLAAKFGDDVVTLTCRDAILWQRAHPRLKNIVTIANPAPAARTVSHDKRHNTKLVVAVGRLTHQKGFDLLLLAWKCVVATRTDWVLHIVGDGEDGDALAMLVDELSLADSVKLVPSTSRIDVVYRAASLYVMSSRFEGLPMVLLEAASAGLPMVSFDCDTGPAEIINDELGWLCEPNNPDALAATLLRAFAQCDDPLRYQSMSRAAANRATHFDLESVTQKWLELLER